MFCQYFSHRSYSERSRLSFILSFLLIHRSCFDEVSILPFSSKIANNTIFVGSTDIVEVTMLLLFFDFSATLFSFCHTPYLTLSRHSNSVCCSSVRGIDMLFWRFLALSRALNCYELSANSLLHRCLIKDFIFQSCGF